MSFRRIGSAAERGRLMALVLASAMAALLSGAPSARAIDLGYAIGGGAVIPTDGELDRLAGPGPHFDLALQYKFFEAFSVGIGLGLDFPIGEELPSGVTPTARFIRIDARAMAHHGVAWFRYWASLGIGLSFNTFSVCNERNFCEAETLSKFGLDASAGVSFVVWDKLSLGPAVGITLPDVTRGDELYFMHASLRLHWNL